MYNGKECYFVLLFLPFNNQDHAFLGERVCRYTGLNTNCQFCISPRSGTCVKLGQDFQSLTSSKVQQVFVKLYPILLVDKLASD